MKFNNNDGRNTINIASTMLNVSSPPPPCEDKKENNKNALKRSPRNIYAMVVLQQFYLLWRNLQNRRSGTINIAVYAFYSTGKVVSDISQKQ